MCLSIPRLRHQRAKAVVRHDVARKLGATELTKPPERCCHSGVAEGGEPVSH